MPEIVGNEAGLHLFRQSAAAEAVIPLAQIAGIQRQTVGDPVLIPGVHDARVIRECGVQSDVFPGSIYIYNAVRMLNVQQSERQAINRCDLNPREG